MQVVKTIFMAFFVLLASCSQEKKVNPIKIGINPWPGYEFLYLAEQKGFFKQVGINVSLVQLSSLSDVQRAYIAGRVDGMASTLIEAVQATQLSGRPVKIVLIPDYSNGGDVVIANRPIHDMKGLRGKNVGVELGSLGIYFLHRALTKNGMMLEDVNMINVEQIDAEQAFDQELIEAFVSYPPMSIELLKYSERAKIFSSAEIPFEIIDTVSVDAEKLAKQPAFVDGLLQAWQMALDYANAHPEESAQIMAEREDISAEEFQAALLDLSILDTEKQKEIFAQPENLKQAVSDVCRVLVEIKSLQKNCETLPDIVYKKITR